VLGAAGWRLTVGETNPRGAAPNARLKLTVSPLLRMTNESAAVRMNFSFCFVNPESVGLSMPTGLTCCCAAQAVADTVAMVVPSAALESEARRSMPESSAEMDLIHRGVSITARVVGVGERIRS
jgi:hypothetical protein